MVDTAITITMTSSRPTVRTTETVSATCTVRATKSRVLAQISAAITTQVCSSASTTRLSVRTMKKIANVTPGKTLTFRKKLARSSTAISSMVYEMTNTTVTSSTTVAATWLMASATSWFHQPIMRPRVLPLEDIIPVMIPPVITITSVAVILLVGSVTTLTFQDGLRRHANKQTATTRLTGFSPLATFHDFTVGTSLTVAVTATYRRRSTAAHVDCWAAISSREVVITPETAQRHCFSPVTVNATEIRLHRKRQTSAVPCSAAVSMTTGMPNVTSRLGCVRLAAMSTVNVSCSAPHCITPGHAVTSAESTSTALAIITPVIVHIIQLEANVIATTNFTVCRICVLISVDTTFSRSFLTVLPLRVRHRSPRLTTRPHHLLLLSEPAITTVSTVQDSLLIDTIAIRIAQRRSAEQHAGTLAVDSPISEVTAHIVLLAS